MKRIILFLIRRRLGLKKHELFRFTNQKTKDLYKFTNDGLMKIVDLNPFINIVNEWPSGVSLSWLLDDDCKIEKISNKEVD
jgi:hypothetical protein